MELALDPRPDSRLRCAVCHDRLSEGRSVCEGCGAILHPECWAGLGGLCPTLGCGRRRPGFALKDDGRTPGRRRTLALAAAALATVALGIAGSYVFRGRCNGEFHEADLAMLAAHYAQPASTDPEPPSSPAPAPTAEETLPDETAWRKKLDAHDWEGARSLLSDVSVAADVQPGSRTRYRQLRALETRGRVHLRLGLLAEADADFTAVLTHEPSSGWCTLLRGCTRLLRADREAGLADLRTTCELWPLDPFPPLWIAAAAGFAPDAPPPRVTIDEPWLQVVWQFLDRGIDAEECLKLVQQVDGSARIPERLCVAHCYVGMFAERRGDAETARAHYEACVATNEVDWLQFDFARNWLRTRRGAERITDRR